jgi:hypothetical protein
MLVRAVTESTSPSDGTTVPVLEPRGTWGTRAFFRTAIETRRGFHLRGCRLRCAQLN